MFKSLRSLFLLFVLAGSLFIYPVETAYAIAIPAEINKQFTPILIDAGGTSVLRVTVFNPNTFPLTNVSWTDNLVGVQPGLSIAPPGLLNSTCGNGVTAVPGTTTLSLSNGTVPPQALSTPGECYVEINVTSTVPGNLINTIPDRNLSANGNDGGTPVTITNTTPASATLTVLSLLPPTLSKGFSPNTISVGNVSTLTITVNNNDSDTNLTGTSFTDTLPAGVVLANPAVGVNPLTNCGGSASLTANPGGNTIALANATVTPSQNCIVTVNVTSNTQDVYVNTIPAGPSAPGSIKTDQGVTNTNPATATLNVQPVNVSKQFSPTAFQAGGTSTLTIIVQNPTGSTYTGVNLSDTLPTTPNANLTYVAGSSATTCIPGTVSNTNTTVSLTDATVPPNSSCTITVNVTAPNGATDATYRNTIPARAITIASHPGATNVVQATADVRVYPTGIGMAGSVKSFFPNTIDAGQNSRLRIDLFAPADTNLTNFSITDSLPAGVTVSNSSLPSAIGCGSTPPLVFAPQVGDTTISLSGGTILAGTRCRIQVYVTSSTPGTVTNRITPDEISNTENRNPPGDLTDNLTVNGLENLSASKAFNLPTVNPGGLSVLTITLQNTYPSPIVDVTVTDPLPGSVTDGIVVAPVPNASTTCTGGSVTAVPGSQTITMTGGTVPAQIENVPGICTITVTVQGNDSNATPSNRTNTIPMTNVSGTVQSTGTTINSITSAQATLRTEILSIGVVKGFNPVLVYGGAYSTMSVQLVNPNNITLTGITFTDNMDLLGSGIELADPVAFDVGACGGALTGDPGDSSFSFRDGVLPPNSNCTLTLRVVMSVNGNRTNRIPAGAVTTDNGVSSTQPTEASLTNLPGASVSKSFNPNAILAGDYSTLTITIKNTSNIPLVGMALTDNFPGALPAGLEIAGASAPAPVNNCGGTLTAVAGSQTIQLTDGSLASDSSCTISVSVTSSVPGSYVNTIPAGALKNDQGATNATPATDTLVVTGNLSGLTKIVSGTNQSFTSGSSVGIGEIVTYQASVVIPPGSHSNATLVDTMQRGLAFVGCDTIIAPGLTTNGNSDFSSVCSNPTVDDAGGGTTADVDRRVTYNFGTLANNGQTDTTLTITYRAIVIDIATNVDGSNLNNSAAWNSSTGNIGPTQSTVNILEPDLTIAKTADVNFIANGSPATFTLVISHTASSNTDAFDVVVLDVLPVGLDFVPNSIDCDDGEQDPDPGTCVYDTATRTIRAQWSTFTRLPASDRGIIRFGVIGNSSIPANGSVTNVANVEWSSMPGDQRTPQSFSVPPNPFATERFYDPNDQVNIYNSSTSLTLTPLGGGNDNEGGGDRGDRRSTTGGAGGFLIPVTGFAPNVVTRLDVETRPTYNSTGLKLEIPVIKVNSPVVGVQLKDGSWDVAWLQNQVGWLNGTAYPTWTGNSVLTGHTVNAVGQPSIFSKLGQLNVGEYIYVYDRGYRYTYKVESNKLVQPNDITVLKHENKAYLTLITCDAYDEKADTYLKRVVVRAVLVDVREAK